MTSGGAGGDEEVAERLSVSRALFLELSAPPASRAEIWRITLLNLLYLS